jgi:hypothetical protein
MLTSCGGTSKCEELVLMLDETDVCIAYIMPRKRSAAVIYGDLYDLEVFLT